MSTTGRAGSGTGDPTTILTVTFERAGKSLAMPIVSDQEMIGRIELVARSSRNRACIRFLLACTLAKSVNPAIDIRMVMYRLLL